VPHPDLNVWQFWNTKQWHSESLGFWTLSNAQDPKELQNTTFWKLDLFPSSCEGRETFIVLGLFTHLKTGTDALFSSYLEFWAMDKGPKPFDPQCYTPLSGCFKIHLAKNLIHITFLTRWQTWGHYPKRLAFEDCLVHWLRLTASKGPNRMSPSPHLKTETNTISERLCFLVI
jgi:hypothetical protein